MPAGADDTVPVPLPFFAIVSGNVVVLNVAVTFTVAARFEIVQVVPTTLLQPVQPANVVLGAGAAVKTTVDVARNGSVQSPGQSMPAGFDVTVPVPVPARFTFTGYEFSEKVAVTVAAPMIVVVHGAVPVQPPPDHPANDEFAAGTAVRSTDVLNAKLNTQVAPQLIPAGFDVTVPVPG